jgi:hypothetical protein
MQTQPYASVGFAPSAAAARPPRPHFFKPGFT